MQALTGLTPAQLRQAQARIAALLPSEPDMRQLTDEQLVHQVVVRLFKERSLPPLPPMPVLAKGARHFPAYRAGVVHLGSFVDEHVRPSTRAQRVKAFSVLVSMLARWLQRQRVPVSHRTLSEALPKVSEVCDQQFPGYLEAGLLPVILRAKGAQR